MTGNFKNDQFSQKAARYIHTKSKNYCLMRNTQNYRFKKFQRSECSEGYKKTDLKIEGVTLADTKKQNMKPKKEQ